MNTPQPGQFGFNRVTPDQGHIIDSVKERHWNTMREIPSDIVQTWAPDPAYLPDWFVDALSVPREEGFVEVSGVRMHYFRWGDRSAPPLLMTHGFLSHARCLAFVAPYLAENYHVIAYDHSGMGDSDVRENCDMGARGREMIGVAAGAGAHAGAEAVGTGALEIGRLECALGHGSSFGFDREKDCQV